MGLTGEFIASPSGEGCKPAALDERPRRLERWRVEAVAPTYGARVADPDSAISLDRPRAAILAHRAACTAKRPGARNFSTR